MPSKGLVTRLPSDFANPDTSQPDRSYQRAATAASNVRFEDGVATNAPGYERVVLCPALDSAALLVHQSNLIAQSAFDTRPCLVFTNGKVVVLQRSSRQLDATQAPPTDCGALTPGLAGTLQLSSPVYSVSEGAGTISIAVQRTLGNTGPVSISYRTQDGTGVAGLDYTAISGSLTWDNGDSADKFIVVSVLDDLLVEGNRTFSVVIYNATDNALLGSPSAATVTILDND